MTATKKVSEAPVDAEQPKTVEVVEISLELLDASAKNPRRTMNEADLQELAASIREHGIQVPLLVRPTLRNVVVELDDGSEYDLPGLSMVDAAPYINGSAFPDRKIVRVEIEDQYEIVCGHRRSEAATIAGLEYVPCIVRELTDEQAAEIALIDNLQRVDVPAIEEAEAFGELLNRLLSVQAVALKVGKKQSYVAQRLKLRTLTCWSRDALREKLITIDHALLLCRLAEEEQNAALKWTLDHTAGSKKPVDKVIAEIVDRRRERAAKYAEDPQEYSYYRHHSFEPQSIVRLKRHIAESSGTPLDRAPWPLDLDLGVDAPKCDECPQNTKANAPLFGDLDLGEPTCTDGGCFREKTLAFVRIQSRMIEGTQAPLRVSWKATSTAPRLDKETGALIESQIFKAGQWAEAKKRCEHSRAGVTVDWSDANDRGRMGRGDKLRKPGEVLQICIEPKCKAHPKDWAKPKSPSQSSGSRNENSPERRAERERHEAEVKAENQIRADLVAAAIAKVEKLSPELLRSVVLRALPKWMDPEEKKRFPGLDKSLKTAPIDSEAFARAAVSLLFVGDDDEDGLFVPDWGNHDVANGRKELLKTLALMGWKGADPWAPAKPEKPKAEKPAVKPAKKTPSKKAAAKKAAKPKAKKGGKR